MPGQSPTNPSQSPHLGAASPLIRWRLKDFDIGQGEPARAFDAPADGDGWIDIEAPGDVYLALYAAGRLPDPFGDRAEKACAWVSDREWWQRTDFEAPAVRPGQRLALNFEGPGHLRHGLAERRGPGPDGQHVPGGVVRHRRPRQARPQPPGRPFHPHLGPCAGQGNTGLVDRCGPDQGDQAQLLAQGPVRMGLGLGSAPAHRGNLETGDAGRRTSRCAAVGEVHHA